ncbi:MAG: hypothetical protein RBG13Loki_3162 [Promethearchaeota archaeon CR_4]|nr:MAG: hypothetical protein RBG13Loki_3162 [Candidatus Lokiarchaeota archaeon CR_4]
MIDLTEALVDIHNKIRVSQEILTKVGAFNIPVLYVFNKIDKLPPKPLESIKEALGKEFPNSVFVSATTGQNFDRLIEGILALHPTKIITKNERAEEESN